MAAPSSTPVAARHIPDKESRTTLRDLLGCDDVAWERDKERSSPVADGRGSVLHHQQLHDGPYGATTPCSPPAQQLWLASAVLPLPAQPIEQLGGLPEKGVDVTRRMLLLLAMTCGVAVGTIYFPQALTPLVAASLHVPPDTAALAVTATQFGYAIGIFVLVPLTDRIQHRTLIVALLVFSGLSLLAASTAPTLILLVAASALIGTTTVAAQVIAPMAAGLVPEDRRGMVTGTLLSGSIGGILLGRAFGGFLGQSTSWRVPYLTAAVLVLLLAVVLSRALPATTPPSTRLYSAVLAESLHLLRTEPQLRCSAFYQATVFGGFTAIWTAVALLLTGPAYRMGAQAVGLLALVGAATMFITPIAGRQVDRHGPDRINLVSLLGVLAAAAALAIGSIGSFAGLAALTVGTLLLDVAMQSGMVANQTRIWALRSEIRGRLNTAYMTCAYLGGAVGSWLGARTYTHLGWLGVCTLLALMATAALSCHLHRLRRPPVSQVAQQRPD